MFRYSKYNSIEFIMIDFIEFIMIQSIEFIMIQFFCIN